MHWALDVQYLHGQSYDRAGDIAIGHKDLTIPLCKKYISQWILVRSVQIQSDSSSNTYVKRRSLT